MDEGLRRVRGAIELELGERPPVGVLTDSSGRRFHFSGWMALGLALEEWRAAVCGRPPRPPADPSKGVT